MVLPFLVIPLLYLAADFVEDSVLIMMLTGRLPVTDGIVDWLRPLSLVKILACIAALAQAGILLASAAKKAFF
jgi:hypothetical protein